MLLLQCVDYFTALLRQLTLLRECLTTENIWQQRKYMAK